MSDLTEIVRNVKLNRENNELKESNEALKNRIKCLINMIDDLHPDDHDDPMCKELGRCICGNDELRKEIKIWKEELEREGE